MTTDEALAVARLRQWCSDRIQLASARTCDYRRRGWQTRTDRQFDSRLVRVIDFGRVMEKLEAEEQAALVLTYRDRERFPAIAQMLHCSIRKLTYMIPAARRKLAAELDRLNLL
jgi:DNA-directed RNA polymerase specialized sigma24 family protein